MKFPEHDAGLFLSHNEHKTYYETVEEFVAEGTPLEWVSEEQKRKAFATNEIWVLQWYPNTPAGFNILAAADLDVLMEAVGE